VTFCQDLSFLVAGRGTAIRYRQNPHDGLDHSAGRLLILFNQRWLGYTGLRSGRRDYYFTHVLLRVQFLSPPAG
jgi:hypothetical protein